MKRIPGPCGLLLALLLFFSTGAVYAEDFKTIDPSGNWESKIGELSLMLTGDALSFSYSAVFGQSAHICDGAGVAGLVSQGRYEYEDEYSTVAFLIEENRVKIRTVKGPVSFCGAGWPGDDFTPRKDRPILKYRIVAKRAYFHVVDAQMEKRPAYVVEGDEVEAVPAYNEGKADWVLARFKGPKITTVGFLLRKDLSDEPISR